MWRRVRKESRVLVRKITVPDDRSKELLGAVKNNDLDRLREIVGAGCDINMESDLASFYAGQSGGQELVEYMLERGGSLSDVLQGACMCRESDFLQWLVENGADINDIPFDDFEMSPIHALVERGRDDLIEWAIGLGASPNILLLSSSKLGRMDLVKRSVEMGGDVSQSAFRPLRNAIGKPEIFEYLLSRYDDDPEHLTRFLDRIVTAVARSSDERSLSLIAEFCNRNRIVVHRVACAAIAWIEASPVSKRKPELVELIQSWGESAKIRNRRRESSANEEEFGVGV